MEQIVLMTETDNTLVKWVLAEGVGCVVMVNRSRRSRMCRDGEQDVL